MTASMTIGDFSRATQLSAKALRFYHEAGLLEPARIDPHNGYRLYAPEQVVDARVIRSLRALDMPVDVVREVLAAPDVEARGQLIARHLARMEQKLDGLRSAVESLRGLLENAHPPLEVVHRSVPAARVVAISDTIDATDLGAWFTAAMRELADLVDLGAVRAAGPYGGVWGTELFLDERGAATLFVPVEPVPDHALLPGRARVVLLPAVELAVAMHRGSDDTVGEVYAALGEYVARHELSVDGPLRETYLQGLPGVDAYAVTEIGWPIFRSTR